MNPYEAIGVAFGIASVYLLARQRIWGWPIGLVNVALFIVVFYDARLYADAALQVVYVGLCLYGWRTWAGAGPGDARIGPGPRAASSVGRDDGAGHGVIGGDWRVDRPAYRRVVALGRRLDDQLQPGCSMDADAQVD